MRIDFFRGRSLRLVLILDVMSNEKAVSPWLICLVTFTITFVICYLIIGLQVSKMMPGAIRVALQSVSCEIWVMDTTIQTTFTVALACPHTDLIRIWPLPVKFEWSDDWDDDLIPGKVT